MYDDERDEYYEEIDDEYYDDIVVEEEEGPLNEAVWSASVVKSEPQYWDDNFRSEEDQAIILRMRRAARWTFGDYYWDVPVSSSNYEQRNPNNGGETYDELETIYEKVAGTFGTSLNCLLQFITKYYGVTPYYMGRGLQKPAVMTEFNTELAIWRALGRGATLLKGECEFDFEMSEAPAE